MMLSIDHSSPIPLHVQVEQLLRSLMKEKQYIEGKPLPKEIELSKVLGIARNTIRQATNKLVYEGILERKKGVGTFVSQKNVSTKLNNWYSFTEEMNQLGIPFKNYSINASFINADAIIAQKLKVKENSEVLELRRLRGDDKGPFVYFISYFHPRIGLTKNEDFTLPLYETLEKKYSTRAITSREEINAIECTKELSDKLEVEINKPILFRKRLVLDPGGRIIEYNLCYYRSDKFTYSIDINKD